MFKHPANYGIDLVITEGHRRADLLAPCLLISLLLLREYRGGGGNDKEDTPKRCFRKTASVVGREITVNDKTIYIYIYISN